MKYIIIYLLIGISYLVAEVEEHHEHVGSSQIKFNYENLSFTDSKQKDDGRRYSVEIDYQNKEHHVQMYVEHTDTKTKPQVAKDLSVNKYSFKYQYQLSKGNVLMLSYIGIEDNLIKDVDRGKVMGIGYKYKGLQFVQYISDYKHFNVYQSDIKLSKKIVFNDVTVKGAMIGKYMYLQNRKGNKYTNKTKKEYFTLGLKVHVDYDKWHVGAGMYVGERIFSVMNDGMKVQHHAMSFDGSMMLLLGYEFDDVLVQIRYATHDANEIPISNENVKVESWAVDFTYKF
ncbi:MAG: hypothetical protein L3J43_06230 [Sulfurovum sp.]|nr:hypothetical protein [Sulfurovum sp.]